MYAPSILKSFDAVRGLVYPALMGGAMLIFFALAAGGIAAPAAAAGAVVAGLVAVMLLERLLPYRGGWQPTAADFGTDTVFLLLVQGLAPRLLGFAIALLLLHAGIALDAAAGAWPSHWPLAAQALTMLLLADLMRYWLHVAAHRVPWLWRLHAIHHQPRKLYSLNVARFHPLEKALQFGFDSLPFILLGVPAEVVSCYFVFYAVNGFCQHGNIDFRFGALNYLVSSSELHRWHHHADPEIANCNYGNNLIVWDLLFGSYYLPRGKQVQRVGIKGVAPVGLIQGLGLAAPARWLRTAGRWFRRQSIAALYRLAKVRLWYRFERLCKNPEMAQARLLRRILKRQARTQFGVQHGFAGMRGYRDFRDRVAVHDYEDLRPLLEREARTGRALLNSEPALLYARTSGSTGSAKYLPITRSALSNLKQSQALATLMMREACPAAFSGKMLGIVSPAEEGYNEWGKPCGSASGLIANSLPAVIRRQQLLPPAVLAIEDHELRYDAIIVLALAEPDISFVGTANPSTLLQLHKLLNRRRDYYLELLGGARRLPALPALHCGAARLRQIRRLFARPAMISFADLWPGIRLLATWTGGSCGLALDTVAGLLPAACKVMDLGYVASEFRGTITHHRSGFGIPTLHENFFEFVARDDWEQGRHEFLRLHQLEPGRQYYIFVTNLNGLYRYDINDIVEVSGRFENTPCLKFVQKGKGVTNITGEKLYESQLLDAVNRLKRERLAQPTFYVCLADETSRKYDLYLETERPAAVGARRLAESVDSFLRAANIEYRCKRDSGRLGRIDVHLLRPGSFELYKKSLLERGQRECQFKVMTLQYARHNRFPFTRHCR